MTDFPRNPTDGQLHPPYPEKSRRRWRADVSAWVAHDIGGIGATLDQIPDGATRIAMTAAERIKLASIEASAKDDQTAAEIIALIDDHFATRIGALPLRLLQPLSTASPTAPRASRSRRPRERRSPAWKRE